MDSISETLKGNGSSPVFDDSNKTIIRKLFSYMMSDSKKGILMYGSIGTGKSTLMRAMNRFYRKSGMRKEVCIETSAINIASKYAEVGDEVFDVLGKPYNENYFIDDIGLEREASHYGNRINVIRDVILTRYEMRNSKKTYITTNMNINELGERYGFQVLDRLKEMCYFVNLDGKSRR